MFLVSFFRLCGDVEVSARGLCRREPHGGAKQEAVGS